MKLTSRLSWIPVFLLASSVASRAALTAFTDHGLGGITASWDIFYGDNYQTSYSFETGTVGNPADTTIPVILTATQTSHSGFPGYTGPSGPIGSDMTIPGDREQFYTFFSNISWSINHILTDSITTFVLQSSASVPFSNVLLNGAAATSSAGGEGLFTWTWNALELDGGDSFVLGWTTGTHESIDAVQIQAGPIPEPSSFALAGLGVASLAFRRRRI